MALNVSYSSNNNGIDTQAIKSVTAQIFKRAEAKNGQASTVDFSSYKRANAMGMDFYNGSVDAATVRSAAMANAGMNIELTQNLAATLQFLNAKAAQKVSKAVEGKLTVAVNEEAQKTEAKVYEFAKFNSIIKSADKDGGNNGSNPFYQKSQKKAEKKDDEALNLLA